MQSSTSNCNETALSRLKARLSMLNVASLGTIDSTTWADTFLYYLFPAMNEVGADDELLELALRYVGWILKVRPQLKPTAFDEFLTTVRCMRPLLECVIEKSAQAIPDEMRALFREYELVDAALLEKILLPVKSSDGSSGLGNDEEADQGSDTVKKTTGAVRGRTNGAEGSAGAYKRGENVGNLERTNSKVPERSSMERNVSDADDNDEDEDKLAKDKPSAYISDSRSHQGASRSRFVSSDKGKRPGVIVMTFEGQKRCEHCRSTNIEICNVPQDSHGKYRACAKCHKLKAKCSYANDGKLRTAKTSESGSSASPPTTLGTTEHNHDLPNAQPEAMVPASASIGRTEPERSANNNAVPSPPHRTYGSGDKLPSNTSIPPIFEEQGPGVHHGVKRKLSDYPTHSPTIRPRHIHAANISDSLLSKRVKAALPSSSVVTYHLHTQISSSAAAPSRGRTPGNTSGYTSSYRQGLLSQRAMALDQVTLAWREFCIAKSNLDTAQRIQKVIVDALKALGDEEPTLTAETSALSLDSDAMVIDTIEREQGEESHENAIE